MGLICSGDLDENEKQHQLEQLQEVREFCDNEMECRRQQILRQFGEQFNAQHCQKRCDVCFRDEAMVKQDFTDTAVNLIRIVSDLTRKGDTLSKTMLVDVFRGSKRKEVVSRGFQNIPLFGVGKCYNKELVTRIIDQLVKQGGLEWSFVRRDVWSVKYIILGLNATGFKERKLSLVLQVKAAESSAPPKDGPSTGSKPRGTAKNPGAESAPAHNYDPLYIDSSGEEDQMEDIQPSSSLGRPAPVTVLPVAPSDNVLTRCFNELLKMRNEIAVENGFANPDDLVHERSIHHLSLLTVEDPEALRRCMLEFEGHKNMFKLCGKQFLAILHNHHFPRLHMKEALHKHYTYRA